MSKNRELTAWHIFGLVFMGMILLALFNYAWRYYMAPVAGRANAEWKIESANSRIDGYERFFDQCSAIQGYEGSIAVQEQALKAVTSPEDKSRITTVLAGLRAQRIRAIAQYNADARKAYTIARFKDSGLPNQINDTDGGNTVCVN